MAAAATASAAGARDPRRRLLGTAYLFTRGGGRVGAITPAFQEAALAAERTVLLESGPGHATRCLPSPFFDEFEAEKRRLRAAGESADEVRDRLEQLNVGRLRIAAKGVDRHPRFGEDPDAPKLVPVDAADQWERGMFMIGQVAALRDRDALARRAAPRRLGRERRAAERRAGPEPAEEPPPGAAGRRGDRRPGCILPGRPTCARSGRTSSARSTRSARSRRALGLAALLRPRPRDARQGLLALGRVRRRGPLRPGRVRHAAELAALDRAVPAAGAADGARRPRRRRLREPAVRPRAHLRDPRRRRRRRRPRRSATPFAPRCRRCWARRRPLGERLCERAAGVDRGQLPRPADERRRRAGSPTGSTSAAPTSRSTPPARRR